MQDRSDSTRLERLAMWEARIAANPKDTEAMWERGGLLYALSRYDEAAATFLMALEVDPAFAPALWSLGSSYFHIARYRDSIDSYRRAVAADPDFTEAWLTLAQALMELKQPNESLLAADQLLSRRYAAAGGWEARASALRALGRYGEADASLRAAALLRASNTLETSTARLVFWEQRLAQAPGNAEALRQRGYALRALGRGTEALEAFDQAVALDPSSPYGHGGRADALRTLGCTEEAVEACRRASQAAPKDPRVWVHLGEALREAGKRAEALEAFQGATRARYNTPDAWLQLGQILAEEKRYGEAAAAYRELTKLAPHDAGGLYGLGHALLRVGDAAGAVAAFDAAMPNAKKPWTVRRERAFALLDTGRSTEALGEAQAAVAGDPSSVRAQFGLAKALAANARPREALAICVALLRTHPREAEVLKLRSELEAGAAAETADPAAQKAAELVKSAIELRADQKHEEAVRLFQQATALRDDLPKAWSMMAQSLERLKRYPEARDAYAKATQYDPADPVAWYGLGLGELRGGKAGPALAAFDRALPLAAKPWIVRADRSIALRLLGRIPEAIADAEAAVKGQPDRAASKMVLAKALAAGGRRDEAAALCTELLGSNPDDASVRKLRDDIRSGAPVK